ncbi:hypothetical protein [Bradymonas sediminis]|uniref:Uncharacterized protein n=1 Tax=Bradymonas sediminis TaxID=1548548 RepID=A0A2Z4FML8_9DELT|nr:hypothetical protein [Bradymonas sediminis]AWV89934.1 hypothetical protein DN745_11525 [Bradymonas sediminis]TDP62156.1 hypothetical protein DFR33_11418 [Bradymonas sediminis]
MTDEKEIRISGRSLKALVRAAETPGIGFALKERLMSQMGLDALFEMDLRDQGEPALSPTMPEVDPQIGVFSFEFESDFDFESD